ncbi:MAG: hypothetical protein HPY50_10655 [Firmicutes bacterium]|nr:hypothetical protein [Bacillota bacterium]
MHIVASFEYSANLELALTAIRQEGIPPEDILAVPLERRAGKRMKIDTLHRSDAVGTFDGAAVLGTICMLLGTIYGFSLAWGPVIWAFIGLLSGGLLGYLLDYLVAEHGRKYRYKSKLGDNQTEVFVVINCFENMADKVENILWENFALGVAKVR